MVGKDEELELKLKLWATILQVTFIKIWKPHLSAELSSTNGE